MRVKEFLGLHYERYLRSLKKLLGLLHEPPPLYFPFDRLEEPKEESQVDLMTRRDLMMRDAESQLQGYLWVQRLRYCVYVVLISVMRVTVVTLAFFAVHAIARGFEQTLDAAQAKEVSVNDNDRTDGDGVPRLRIAEDSWRLVVNLWSTYIFLEGLWMAASCWVGWTSFRPLPADELPWRGESAGGDV